MKRMLAVILLFAFFLLPVSCAHNAEFENGLAVMSTDISESPGSEDLTAEGKIRLTIAAFEKENSEYDLESYRWLETAVREFNAEDDKYEAQIVGCGDLADADALYRLNAEIMVGNMPDLLVTYGMPAEKYAKAGLLTDLFNWYESNQFFQGPLEAMEYDGKLYWVSPHFSIASFYGLKSVLGEKDVYGFNDIRKAWESFNNGENVFMRQFNGFYVFLILAMMQLDRFVDPEEAVCRFDSDEFIQLLAFCGELPEEVKVTQTESNYPDGAFYITDAHCIRNRDAMLGLILTNKEMGLILSLHASILTALQGEEIAYIGIPGSKPAATGCIIEMPVAVSAQTKYPEGAKAFLDSLWDIEYTKRHQVNMRRLPLSQSVFEENIDDIRKRHTQTYTDEDGQEYTALNLGDQFLPYTDKDLDDFRLMIENARIPVSLAGLNAGSSSGEISIIQEEAAKFFVILKHWGRFFCFTISRLN